jgi:hypothetical protein
VLKYLAVSIAAFLVLAFIGAQFDIPILKAIENLLMQTAALVYKPDHRLANLSQAAL